MVHLPGLLEQETLRLRSIHMPRAAAVHTGAEAVHTGVEDTHTGAADTTGRCAQSAAQCPSAQVRWTLTAYRS